ncbi:MAG: hypothetical protein HFG46_06665 [Clostridium sp.]|jgi:hypothetical protein|nr:hypothetical protein [Clostridium sp.]
MTNFNNDPNIKLAQEIANSPMLKIAQEMANSPAFKFAQEMANSPAFKFAQEIANSPAFKFAQEMANSPAFKFAQEMANSPAFKFAQEMANNPEIKLLTQQVIENMQYGQDIFSTEQFNAIFEHMFLQLKKNKLDESDYVIVDEKPVKEISVPDTLAIPAGNYRVKIKTEYFIAILFGILSLIVSIASSIIASSSSLNTDRIQEEQIYIQTQQWQNQILNRLLDSVDASSSSQAEAIEALREAVQSQTEALDMQAQAVEALQEAVDSFQESADSINKSEDTEP